MREGDSLASIAAQLWAALPSVIGNTIGNLIGGAIQESGLKHAADKLAHLDSLPDELKGN